MNNNFIKLSIIIPVYNRPDEVDELLASLSYQSDKDFEVVIVEDGSKIASEHLVEKYSEELKIKYVYQDNTGPALARNKGILNATGNYFVFFDSDLIVPKDYIKIVKDNLNKQWVDAYGGPDAAHPSFTSIQKAINYSMTSFFTTGGIRGGKKKMDKFYPRSFNMGISEQVYIKTKGFADMRFGEDVDFSLRIVKSGFSTRLIPEAFVYHKRRTNFRQFYKQVFNSGIARIHLNKRHPGSLKLVHALPSAFLIGAILMFLLALWKVWFLIPIAVHVLSIFFDSLIKNRNLNVAFLSILASYTQLTAYGLGFIKSFWKRIILKKGEFKAFEANFYE